MRLLATVLIALAAIWVTPARGAVLSLDVVTYLNEPADGKADILSERARPTDENNRWHLETVPFRPWLEVTVKLTDVPKGIEPFQMTYRLPYQRLLNPEAAFHFAAVVASGWFGNPVVAAFRNSLTPEPTRRNPAYLMRAHHKALYLWRARQNHFARNGMSSFFAEDIRLAYWVLRTARDLNEELGLVLTPQVQDVAAWVEELLDDPESNSWFRSDTASAQVFRLIIEALEDHEQRFLAGVVNAMGDDIGQRYVAGAPDRGCAVARRMKEHFETAGLPYRRKADPNGTHFLRTVTNLALCTARLVNRRPIEPGAVDDAQLVEARGIVHQIQAMLAHDDFDDARRSVREHARSEAINLKNAIEDFERAAGAAEPDELDTRPADS